MAEQAITSWLQQWHEGEQNSLSEVVCALYRDLKRSAGRCLSGDRSHHTLQATALVHEAYLRLASGRPFTCVGRQQFLYIARRLMNQILIQYARRRGAAKRDGLRTRVAIDELGLEEGAIAHATNSSNLEQALNGLRRYHPRVHLAVEMHYRCGFTIAEIASACDASERTIERELQYARTWLRSELAKR
jgi:RNA polymerase sigma factor (TIGR02999 family)